MIEGCFLGASANYFGGTGPTLTLSGVVSGSPLVLSVPSTQLAVISDTFGYTWTHLETGGSTNYSQLYLGTGGSGTSGTVTVTSSITGLQYGNALLSSFVNFDPTLSGLTILDGHGNSNSPTCAVLTPSRDYDCVVATAHSQYGCNGFVAGVTPDGVWIVVDPILGPYYGAVLGGTAGWLGPSPPLANPANGVATDVVFVGAPPGFIGTTICLIKGVPGVQGQLVMRPW